MQDHRPTLEYSSPDDERAWFKDADNERRAAVKSFYESIFGVGPSLAVTILSFIAFVVVASLAVMLLPNGAAEPIICIASIAFTIWRFKCGIW